MANASFAKQHFTRYADDINEISNAATMELQIEKGLRAIVETWSTMQIEIVPHKDRGVFKCVSGRGRRKSSSIIFSGSKAWKTASKP